ncbi:AraC family transcriptional regulator [Anaerobacillus alkaliphilus]|uniref:AraC family transcriptional regulator n=1 Tax=Anaerobacillus alkaliphilus TaxID=1548597 RepID=A0A4Q0VXP7_9BACI|nr:helix-turn-helix domain-containing protein [Anaerobacillus alkaliphilus]RXJ02528.1 AraC family transcriptional regulator [Anaerobacillus alkaliphilus]
MQRGKTKFFFKLLAFILFLSTFPIIIVGTFSYIKTSDAIYQKVMQEKVQSIYQINTNVEQVLKTIDHSLTYFVNSSFLKETLKEPMGAEQFQNYRQLKQELNYLQTFDTGIEDILIVSLEKKWLVNNNGLRTLDNLDIEHQFSEYLRSPYNTRWILESKDTVVNEDNDFIESLLPCGYSVKLVKQLPLITSNKTGLSTASIPSCYLANILTSSSDTEMLMILDSQFRVLAHNDQSLIGTNYSNLPVVELLSAPDFQPSGQLTATIDSINYTLTYRKSDYNGWLYLSVISNEELKSEATAIGLFTLYVCMSVLIGCLVFSWFGSKRLYKPINQLYKTMMSSIKTTTLQKQLHKDELEVIGDRIHHMLAENKELEVKIQGQVDQLRQLFMVRLLDGHLGEEELMMKYLSYDFNSKWKQLCVLTLQIDTIENTKYSPGQKDLLLFTINNIIEDIIPEDQRLTPILRKDVQITIILSNHETMEEYENFIHEEAIRIQTKVKEELDLPISIGVSLPFSKLSKSREAYLEGVEALKHRIKSGMNSILYYKNIETGSSLQTFFPENIKNELFDAIKLGEKEKAEEALSMLISTIFSKDLNPNQYQISLIRLLNDLILLTQTLGVELENFDDKKSLYDQLFELKSIEEIGNWFKESIIFPLVSSLEERINSQYKNISDKIIHIIQQEYDTDISLEAIAERLHYNPNYLSSIFRKETNISFSEYVSMYRLNMAKKMLVESDLSIKEIAEMFRYNNSQNFIRSFKKKEGITPGKYRELHAANKFD